MNPPTYKNLRSFHDNLKKRGKIERKRVKSLLKAQINIFKLSFCFDFMWQFTTNVKHPTTCPRASDCIYNNEKYNEGTQVSTAEPCLNCTCSRSILVCYLRVCPQLPNPPPRGCILLHRYRTCCPELICEGKKCFWGKQR